MSDAYTPSPGAAAAYAWQRAADDIPSPSDFGWEALTELGPHDEDEPHHDDEPENTDD